jgi:hypothetical protein
VTDDPLSTLRELASDEAVTRVTIRASAPRGGRPHIISEVVRNGSPSSPQILRDPDDLQRVLDALIGEGAAAGRAEIGALSGIGARPPASDAPVLLLDRAPKTRAKAPLPRPMAEMAASALSSGAGVIAASPSDTLLEAAVAAICSRLPRDVRLISLLGPDDIRAPAGAVRLHGAGPDAARGARRSVAVLPPHRVPRPPKSPRAALIPVRARSLEAALAAVSAPWRVSPPLLAPLLSDLAPVALWIPPRPSPLSPLAAYEVLPREDPSGLPVLQAVAAADPESGDVLPCGAVPCGPDVAEALEAAQILGPAPGAEPPAVSPAAGRQGGILGRE